VSRIEIFLDSDGAFFYFLTAKRTVEQFEEPISKRLLQDSETGICPARADKTLNDSSIFCAGLTHG